MNNIQYNQNRYNRKKQRYRFKLGIHQLINYPIINLVWIVFVIGNYFLIHLRRIILTSFDVPQLLVPVFNGCMTFFVIAFPILLAIGLLQGIGELAAKRDEADIFRAFSDRRDAMNEAPILIFKKKIKGKKVTVREFYTTIPMERWQQRKEAISDIMNIHIIGEIEYSNHNGNKIIMKSAKGRKATKRGILYDDTF
ncbi:hypothetical protein [Lacrimispora sp.]|uniref:hypothetical protein n=1 Tax=Lacrimispora sp. TaxID=2719234 RepID=UPI00285A74DF|nr:hypothetical protein [Lacrimispora sp.]MDR7810556.1 hypothetical protein [Lacrimispora sp.]